MSAEEENFFEALHKYPALLESHDAHSELDHLFGPALAKLGLTSNTELQAALELEVPLQQLLSPRRLVVSSGQFHHIHDTETEAKRKAKDGTEMARKDFIERFGGV